LHDFSPGILPGGLFWIVKVPDSAVQITGNTLTIHLENVPEIDAFKFPPGTGNGITPFPVVLAKVSFDISYTKTGNVRHIRPTSHDPLSPFNWAGEMWDATNSGTFSVAYVDGSFSASGSFSSSGNFGEMGTERNGSFLESDDFVSASGAIAEAEPSSRALEVSGNVTQIGPRLKGRALLPQPGR
jgi:hypothetical protein